MAKKDTKQYDGGTIKIQYYKSVIGYSKKQKDIVKSFGHHQTQSNRLAPG